MNSEIRPLSGEGVLSLPALSMWQPWATALVRGIKLNETRPRRINEKFLGRPVYIQAAKKLPNAGVELFDDLISDRFGPHWGLELPRGAVIGHVIFDAVRRTENCRDGQTEDELMLGNWTDGRWAYHVSERCEYSSPVKCGGQQAVPFQIMDRDIIIALRARIAHPASRKEK